MQVRRRRTNSNRALLKSWKILLAGICAGSSLACAGGIQTLDVVEVTVPSADLIGVAGAASEGTVTARQLENRPLLRPAEVLEVVPGLIISQHSGDGKANQYYLRGFNLDHGTDFATSLMGMPVNLPTHAHGQGYSDLQFLMPELVERMQYRKGPYSAEVGDFGSAGSASIDYFRKLESNFADFSVGTHGYRRGLVAGSPLAGKGNLLYALEWAGNDGPWTSPEKLDKLNGLLRYSEGIRMNGWSMAVMAYQAQWASTDQVPQRAIDAGIVSRYGSLDPTDGGKTHRYSLSGEWSDKRADKWIRGNVYAMDYSLNLWSNFTFCTLGCNPGPGDQFEQADRRKVYGLHLAETWYGNWIAQGADLTLGLQSRFDDIGNVGLHTTTARQRWGTVAQDRVREGSAGLYAEARVQWQETFRSIVGLRQDFYRFDVTADTPENSGRVNAQITSPKLVLVFGPWSKTEYYVNLGYGFHSNDARGITVKTNPDFRDSGYGTPARSSTPLVRARGYEFGVRTAIIPGLHSSLAIWQLNLDSELVFVGDAGTTEAGFPSRRTGIEWANYWTPTSSTTIDADFSISRARYVSDDGSAGGDYIAGAIRRVASVGVSIDSGGGWSAGLRMRYFGPRPLVEDNSVRSKASTLANLRASYKINNRTKLTLDVLNVLNRKVSDIDYYYASQLGGESVPVNDIHTHPSEPRTYRLSARIGF